MPPVVRAYDLVTDLRTRAELLRQRQLENSVLGLIRANQIQANLITLGIDGNVAVDPGALSLNDPDSLVDIPTGSFTVGDAASLITIPPAAITAGGNPAIAQALIPTSGITNTLLAPDSVTTAKVAANAIGANEIAANAIIAGKIAAGAVTTAKLDAGAVTAAKIDVNRLDLISKDYKSDTAVPRIELSASGMLIWSEQALPGDAPTNNCITYRYEDTGASEFSVGQVRGNHPLVGGDQAHQMEMVSFTMGATTALISTKMTVRNQFGDELDYLTVHHNGSIEGSAAYSNTSDRKVKTDIVDLEVGLGAVRQLQPRRFKRIGRERHEHGFVAQEVEQVIPEAVHTGYVSKPKQRDDGTFEENLEPVKMLTESHILAHVVKAMQELSDDVDKLKAKVK